MFRLDSEVNKRYFDVTFTIEEDDGTLKDYVYSVEAPRLRTLKKIQMLTRKDDSEDVIENLQEIITEVLSKNKGRRSVPEKIVEDMSIDETVALLTAFVAWLNGERARKN